MLKNGLLLIILTIFFAGCAGAIKLAEEEKGSTVPNDNRIVKPQK